MLDDTFDSALSRGANETIRFARAELFVIGEYTYADEATRNFILQLLSEIGILGDAAQHMTTDGQPPRLNKKATEKVTKQICFAASFLKVALQVDRFGILMDRHRWTGTPCGYQAARSITKALLEKGYILKVAEPRKRQSTVYRCSGAFKMRLLGRSNSLNFRREAHITVEVREPKRDYRGSIKKRRIPLTRFPSDEVRQHHLTITRLNKHLTCHLLVDATGRPLDTALRRIFAGDLNNGGRLYADYQNMPEEARLRCRIDGEEVCEIDLKASHVAILAALFQYPKRLPKDPYSAIGWVDTPLHRKAAKTIVQCIIHADDGCPQKFPRQNDGVPFKEKYGLAETRMADLLPDIFQVMPFLKGSPRLTLQLQFLEAEILIRVQEKCRLRGIPAFPIHDSLLVKRSDEEAVLCLLQETLTESLGPHAPWLDVSTAGEVPKLIKPTPCPIDASYKLQETLTEIR